MSGSLAMSLSVRRETSLARERRPVFLFLANAASEGTMRFGSITGVPQTQRKLMSPCVVFSGWSSKSPRQREIKGAAPHQYGYRMYLCTHTYAHYVTAHTHMHIKGSVQRIIILWLRCRIKGVFLFFCKAQIYIHIEDIHISTLLWPSIATDHHSNFSLFLFIRYATNVIPSDCCFFFLILFCSCWFSSFCFPWRRALSRFSSGFLEHLAPRSFSQQQRISPRMTRRSSASLKGLGRRLSRARPSSGKPSLVHEEHRRQERKWPADTFLAPGVHWAARHRPRRRHPGPRLMLPGLLCTLISHFLWAADIRQSTRHNNLRADASSSRPSSLLLRKFLFGRKYSWVEHWPHSQWIAGPAIPSKAKCAFNLKCGGTFGATRRHSGTSLS